MVHAWEVTPDLGATWLVTPTLPVPVLSGERIASSSAEIRLAEARLAFRHATDPRLEGAAEALQQLQQQLSLPEPNRQLRLTQAAAALALATPEHADGLWQRLHRQTDTRRLIEQQLIRWQRPQGVAEWRKRLVDPTAPWLDLRLAIEGIGALGEAQDQAALEQLLRSDRLPTALHVVIAGSLGQLVDQGLEQLAADVLASGVEQTDLLAARLLAGHASDRARDMLLALLQSPHLPAQVAAYTALSEHHHQSAWEVAEEMLQRPDNNLRHLALSVLQRAEDSQSLRLQGTALYDANANVRNTAREHLLHKAASPALRRVVDTIISEAFASNHLPANQQAIYLSVALEDESRCRDLLPLLDSTDLDTSLIAGWGLQQLATSNDTLDSMLEFAQGVTQRLEQEQRVQFLEILRQSFLFEAFGKNRYQAAVPMLRIYVPKNGHKMGDVARASAIWALGTTLQSSRDEPLARQLAQRMLDESISDPEDELVQFTSALALGWLGVPGSVGDLRRVVAEPPAPLGLARNWSLEQLDQP